MKRLLLLSTFLFTILPHVHARAACHGDDSAKSASTPAAAAFEQLKALAGQWQVQGNDSKVTYELQSNGHALVENFWGMMSVYHLDGDSILMTHYCDIGNQPRVRATEFASPLQQLEFKFVDVTNRQAGQGYINGVRIELLGADHVRETWMSNDDNGKPVVIELTRIK